MPGMTDEDERIAARLREQLAAVANLTEKKMFGGLAFLVGGNMSVGVNKGELLVRASPDEFAELCARPGARPMDFTGRPMKGWVSVSAEGFETDDQLAAWVDASLSYVLGLPAKGSGRGR